MLILKYGSPEANKFSTYFNLIGSEVSAFHTVRAENNHQRMTTGRMQLRNEVSVLTCYTE